MIDAASRRALLALARDAIAGELGAEDVLARTELAELSSLPLLAQRRGAFVTLTRHRRLRGCIGRVEPDSPLHALIPDVARSAAFSDPRFPPVVASELSSLMVEISLLSSLSPPVRARDILVGRHGVVVAGRGRRGLLLPQVAVEYGWTREEFVQQVCVKAGLARDAWRERGIRLQTFTAEVFSEDDRETR